MTDPASPVLVENRRRAKSFGDKPALTGVTLPSLPVREVGTGRLWLVVVTVGLAPVGEYLFRGLLFKSLQREWGVGQAVLGRACFFAIYHPVRVAARSVSWASRARCCSAARGTWRRASCCT